MLWYKCCANVGLMLAPRVCGIQFVGNQEWYVFPKGRWGELPVGWCNRGHGVVVCFLRGGAVKVERVGCRVKVEAEEEAVCDRAEAAEGVNNEGDQEGSHIVTPTEAD
jgi:hypothetical protein